MPAWIDTLRDLPEEKRSALPDWALEVSSNISPAVKKKIVKAMKEAQPHLLELAQQKSDVAQAKTAAAAAAIAKDAANTDGAATSGKEGGAPVVEEEEDSAEHPASNINVSLAEDDIDWQSTAALPNLAADPASLPTWAKKVRSALPKDVQDALDKLTKLAEENSQIDEDGDSVPDWIQAVQKLPALHGPEDVPAFIAKVREFDQVDPSKPASVAARSAGAPNVKPEEVAKVVAALDEAMGAPEEGVVSSWTSWLGFGGE